jgi:hypothetical protein
MPRQTEKRTGHDLHSPRKCLHPTRLGFAGVMPWKPEPLTLERIEVSRGNGF